jgi:23S rRNA (uracil1939-C5)-methyltransferase
VSEAAARRASAAPSVRITALASSGEGVGRLADGRVVFVEGAAPGDLVEPCDEHGGRRWVRARIGRLVEPSADRVEPRCPHFGACGGCQWQHIAYPAQLAAKRTIVRDALARIGGLAVDDEIEIVASPEAYGYRTRARLVERAGTLGFRRRASREIEPVKTCPVLVPAAETGREALARAVRLADERDASEPERARAPVRRRRGRRPREIEWELLAGEGGAFAWARVGDRRRASPLELRVLGETLRAAPGSFVQANALLWDDLAAEVRRQVLRAYDACDGGPDADVAGGRPRCFLELFAGVGFLTLPLLRAGLTGVAIESNHSAVRDLEANLASAGLADRLEVLADRVEARDDLAARIGGSDVLIVDPPRLGLGAQLCGTVARARPRRVVYVSCDPATLARDLRGLVDGAGYRLASVRAFDLFPQTPHVETVVRLETSPTRAV